MVLFHDSWVSYIGGLRAMISLVKFCKHFDAFS